MGTGLFMPHQDVFDPALILSDVQGVVNRQDRPSRITEDRLHSMEAQGIHQCLCTGDRSWCDRFLPADARWCGGEGHGKWSGLTLKIKGLQG